MGSADFASSARTAQAPSSFTRTRKLPLPALVGVLLSQRSSSAQVLLDSFFGHLAHGAQWLRTVSDRALAKAREKLNWNALPGLNAWLMARVQDQGVLPRWQGLRVVAADASVLRPALRKCDLGRRSAKADQRLFGLYLPGSELMLHAQIHGADVPERQMLVEALEHLGPDDVLVLDRGYPATWLVALLNERGIRFCIRCDKANGWKPMRDFLLSGQQERSGVVLRAPSQADARDYGCSGQAPTVRLVRCVASTGQVRVMATNLTAQEAPALAFADLYHQRWRIEEAFKRLKHRLHLESVGGLSQQAVLVDVAAKVLADNLAALLCAAAQQDLPPQRQCNRTYAAQLMPQVLGRWLTGVGSLTESLARVVGLLVKATVRSVPNRSAPRPNRHVKPHPSLAYKG